MKNSRLLLLIVFVSYGFTAFFEVSYPHEQFTISSIHGLFVASVAYNWCRLHALEHGFEAIGREKILIFFILPIGAAFYFRRRFGWRVGAFKFLKGVLFAAVVLIFYVGSYEVFWQFMH